MNVIGDEAILIYTQEIASKAPALRPANASPPFSKTQKREEKNQKAPSNACAERRNLIFFKNFLPKYTGRNLYDRFDLNGIIGVVTCHMRDRGYQIGKFSMID
jgi:hypothetical protein